MSKYEETLERALNDAPDLSGWVREFVAIPGRKFRWDFAWPDSMLLVEIQGGIFVRRSAHSGPTAQKRDMEKNNLAVCAGYRTLTFGPHSLTARTIDDTMDVIRAALIAPIRRRETK